MLRSYLDLEDEILEKVLDNNYYDLIINTGSIDLDQTARLIKDYVKLRGIEF